MILEINGEFERDKQQRQVSLNQLTDTIEKELNQFQDTMHIEKQVVLIASTTRRSVRRLPARSAA